MARKHLRVAFAGLALTATLAIAPPPAAAAGGDGAPRPTLAEAAWRWVVGIWSIGLQIDPNGISLQIDPDGATVPPAGDTGDISFQIDPDG